ncbi:MAG: argininosuccinate synthase [Bacillales bacterium]|nr:argininosuccinate synthase [Bacillales bacterium]
MGKKVVLAYSGGLDTSVAIRWLTDQGYEVVALCLDLGEGKDLEFIKQKALKVGLYHAHLSQKNLLRLLSLKTLLQLLMVVLVKVMIKCVLKYQFKH